MRVALVHDYLVQGLRGAERVLAVLHSMWSEAPVYTLVHDPEAMGPEFAGWDIRTSFIQRLPGGNTVVCNWGGHGHTGQQPLIFEVTPDKKVVWQVTDYQQFKAISGVQVLDVPGDVTKGEVLR